MISEISVKWKVGRGHVVTHARAPRQRKEEKKKEERERGAHLCLVVTELHHHPGPIYHLSIYINQTKYALSHSHPKPKRLLSPSRYSFFPLSLYLSHAPNKCFLNERIPFLMLSLSVTDPNSYPYHFISVLPFFFGTCFFCCCCLIYLYCIWPLLKRKRKEKKNGLRVCFLFSGSRRFLIQRIEMYLGFVGVSVRKRGNISLWFPSASFWFSREPNGEVTLTRFI